VSVVGTVDPRKSQSTSADISVAAAVECGVREVLVVVSWVFEVVSLETPIDAEIPIPSGLLPHADTRWLLAPILYRDNNFINAENTLLCTLGYARKTASVVRYGVEITGSDAVGDRRQVGVGYVARILLLEVPDDVLDVAVQ
jgi:hypothetical protein